MEWKDSGGGADFEPAPIGTHPGRCVKVIDIGTQRGEYQGKVTIKRQCVIGWELPTELIQDGNLSGQPFVVSKFYTASLGEKANLRKDLENWRGKALTEGDLAGFKAKNILGKTCLVSVIHTDKGKAKVAGVMALPKGMEVPPQVNPSVYFSLDEFSQATYDTLSDGMKKLIAASPEYQQIISGSRRNVQTDAYPDPAEEDIPF